MNSTVAVGLLWPLDGASLWEGFVLLVMCAALLAVVPVGWVLIRRRFGVHAAGPLWPLVAFLVLASLYAVLTPPWQTPDEPRHMVYVELVRRSGTSLPSQLASGKQMSMEQWALNGEVHASVAQSLRQVDRWPPDPQRIIDRGGIPGPSEVVHPPLYYVMASSLTTPLGQAPILARLGLLRAFGVMVAGWVVWLAGAAGRLLWPRRRIAEAPMAAVVGVPAFAALAGTVNSDVLANFFAAALIVLALVVTRPSVPPRRWHLALLSVVLVLGLLSKRSFVPLVLVVLAIVLLRRRFTLRQALGAAVAVQLLLGVTILTSPPARPPLWTAAGLTRCADGIEGHYALCGIRARARLTQHLTVSTAERLSGVDATIGYWARTPRPATVGVTMGARTELRSVGPEWSFQRVVVPVPEIQRYEDPANRLLQRQVSLTIVATDTLSIDGIVLAAGEFPDVPPQYIGDGNEVVWGDRRMKNLVANASAEDGVVSLPEWLPSTIERAGRGAVDAAYLLLRDNERVFEASDVIRHRLGGAFGIFWGTVGWDQPPRLLSPVFLWILGAMTGLGLAAAALAPPTPDGRVWRDRRGLLALTAVAGVVVAVIFRGLPPTDTELLSGRYLFPGLVAIAVCLVAGWRSLLTVDDLRLRRWARVFAASTQTTFVLTVFLPFRLG